MWNIQQKVLSAGKIIWYGIEKDNLLLSFEEIIDLWQISENFRTLFIELLRNSPFDSYKWETPPVTKNTIKKTFEFVLYNSPYLKFSPDYRPFSPYFINKTQSNNIVTFKNLGGDATLIVPCPINLDDDYSTIATFVNNAPLSQQHQLWQSVGFNMTQRLNHQPVWLNTAGAGVFWLHIRLDDRPKYYAYQPYVNISLQ